MLFFGMSFESRGEISVQGFQSHPSLNKTNPILPEQLQHGDCQAGCSLEYLCGLLPNASGNSAQLSVTHLGLLQDASTGMLATNSTSNVARIV